VLSEQGKYDEAEVDIRMTWEVLGPEHSDKLATIDT